MIWLLIIIVLIVIILFNSFSKFNRWMKQNEDLLKDINLKISSNPDKIELYFIKAECLMKLQNYYQAVKVYEFVIANSNKLTRYKNEIIEDSKFNIGFCRKPLPWSSGSLYDRGASYLHWQLLLISANQRRYSAINFI